MEGLEQYQAGTVTLGILTTETIWVQIGFFITWENSGAYFDWVHEYGLQESSSYRTSLADMHSSKRVL